MIGQGMRREQFRLVGQRKNRPAPVSGFDSQQAAGPPKIDNVHRCTQPSRQPAARIEQRNGVKRGVVEHRDVDVAVCSLLPSGSAPVQPGSKQTTVGECCLELVNQHFGEVIEGDHNPCIIPRRT